MRLHSLSQWPSALQRASGRSDLVAVRWSVLAGVFGATGVAATVYAGQRGPLAPVIVATSMYTVVGAALAWLFLNERLTRRQMFGLVTAVVGVALIALD